MCEHVDHLRLDYTGAEKQSTLRELMGEEMVNNLTPKEEEFVGDLDGECVPLEEMLKENGGKRPNGDG